LVACAGEPVGLREGDKQRVALPSMRKLRTERCVAICAAKTPIKTLKQSDLRFLIPGFCVLSVPPEPGEQTGSRDDQPSCFGILRQD